MVTALQTLKDLWGAGEHRKALKLAASWPRLGEHKRAITQGWAATSNPAFYREIGREPAELYRNGLAAVATRYGLPLPQEQGSV